MVKKEKKLPKVWRDAAAHREANGGALVPAPDNPYCIKCGLCNHRAKNFLEPQGADDPWITVVFDGVSWKEDDANEVATEGSRNGHVRRTMEDLAKSIGFPIERIRWLPITRCANRIKAQVNYRTKGNWCRVFAVEDLMIHPPRLVLAVGSVPLGLLSHKGNAFDWSGKILTWRGWPDDWLTAAQYDEGHPSLPRPSMDTLPLYAVQAPHIITALQNMRETARWKGQLREAMELAMEGAVVPDFNRDYFKLLEDPDAIIAALRAIPDGTLTTYDSETMGLLPWAPGAAIVAMMFRYDHPEDGPVCFGFPWDFPESPLKPHLSKILPVLLETFYRLKLQGHNLTFDILYAYATLKADLRKITQAMACDTRHLIYTLHQTKESLGLELVAYRWCPDMAGYEEEFTLIKDHTALADYLDPGKDEGGHYSRALLLGDEVKKAYTTYIMGDVEVCHIGAINIRKKLDSAKIYPFPLADPGHLGRFRPFTPPARSFVYDKIMLPANRMLTRLMGQGMQVNLAELEHQENIFPKMIKEARLKLREMDDQVAQWCEEQEATTVGKDGKTWQLDLESRDQLKHILFNIMKLPVKRLTKSGIKKYGEKIEEVPAEHLMEFAAVDKYTINALAAEHADRLALPDGTVPLMDYRKLYKAYTAFVRSMRNVTTEGIDKSDRKQPPYLQTDGRVHASFNQCGTRSGRLGCCVSGDTLLKTSVGLVKIEDIVLSEGEVTILTHENRWKCIRGLHWKGVQPMYRLKTAGGREVVCTLGHHLLTHMGWRPLSDIALGDEVVIDSNPREGVETQTQIEPPLHHVSFGRTPLCGVISESEKDGLGTEGNGDKQEVGVANSEVLEVCEPHLQSAILGTSQASTEFNVHRSQEGLSSSHYHRGSEETGGTTLSGLGFNAYSEGTRNHGVLDKQEYTASRPTHSTLSAQAHLNTLHGVPDRRDRQTVPRASTSIGQLPSGQSNVYKKVLQRLSQDALARSFSERDSGGDDSARQNFRSNPAPDKLVDQLSRDSHISSSGGEQHSTHPRVCIFWDEEGRLCDYWHEHLSGTGWGVPQLRGGQGQGRSPNENGLQGSPLQGQSSSVCARESLGVYQGRDTVVSVTFEDYLGVWDIEVEDDYSYVAQGLIHHNSRPNLAQLPSSQKVIVKRLYSSRWGNAGCIYQGDLSQIELRLLAAACGDPLMVDAYQRGIDLHSLTASNIFEIPYEHLHKDYFAWLQKNGRDKEAKDLERKRSIAKTTNFLTGYGGGSFGLQTTLAEEQVYLDQEECENIIDAMFDTYPTLRRYIGVYKNFILEHGCAVSIFGRVRPLPEVESEDNQLVNKSLRAGFNHLIQSTASDMMLLGMSVIDQALFDQNLKSCLVSTVHDSLVVDAQISELPLVHEIVTGVINNLPEILDAVLGPNYDTTWCRILPLTGDTELGRNYFDQKKTDGFKDASGEVDWDKVKKHLSQDHSS